MGELDLQQSILGEAMTENEMLFRAIIDGDSTTVEFREGDTVLEALLRAELPINHSCGGNGSCGTCRVRVLRGLQELHSMNDVESEMAADRSFAPNERLACQIMPRESLEIEIES
jgi:2Fe-2S ferredoxin